MSKNKLFISYAVKDKELADALVDLLETGTSLKSADVCYSSLKERGVAGGDDFITYIKSHIQNPELAIILLSPNYFANRLCLCEMGSVMAMSRNVLPILVPPLAKRHVQGIFPDTRIVKIDSTSDLNKLAAQLEEHLELVDLHLPRWAVKKKQFIASLPSILDEI